MPTIISTRAALLAGALGALCLAPPCQEPAAAPKPAVKYVLDAGEYGLLVWKTKVDQRLDAIEKRLARIEEKLSK